MAFPVPVAWKTATVPCFVRHFSSASVVASTIVICCSKTEFLDALQESPYSGLEHADTSSSDEPSTDAQSYETATPISTAIMRPTLQLLSTAKNVRLAFCPDITHLRAYLATYSAILASRSEHPSESGDSRHIPFLAILNLIQLHRSTSAFSAQGLNRTMATAVEAAFQTRSRLAIVECPLVTASMEPLEDLQPQAETDDRDPLSDLWDEEVSILNVTTKSFGVGSRGWTGRTVSLRSVVGRWCQFVDPDPMR